MLITISCVFFQTAVTIYLFNINKTGDSFEKNLTRILIVLLVHVCLSLCLLLVVKKESLYGQVVSLFGLAYGPLLYIIICSFSGKALPRRIALVHSFPFFAASVISIALIAGSLSKKISDNFIISYTTIFQWIVVATLIVYSILVKNALARCRLVVAFGNENEKVKWTLLNNISAILGAGVLCGIFFELTKVIESPFLNLHLRVIPYISFAVIPVLILRYKLDFRYSRPGGSGAKNEKALVPKISEQLLNIPEAVANVAMGPVAIASSAKRYEKSSLDESTMDDYEQALKKYVESSKIFLTAELSLEELAQQVKIPKHHLTQLLNDRLGKNFYNYINEYRVQEAIIRLKNIHQDVNILSLAYDCGFNSKSSFNNYFKKVTQHTPSSYRKMVESPGNSSTQTTA